MEEIKDTIKTVIEILELRRRKSPKNDLETLLKRAFSKKEQGHIKLNYLKRGILNINVDSSVWLYHLNLQKDALLTKLRRGASAIKDIRFKLGETRWPEKK